MKKLLNFVHDQDMDEESHSNVLYEMQLLIHAITSKFWFTYPLLVEAP